MPRRGGGRRGGVRGRGAGGGGRGCGTAPSSLSPVPSPAVSQPSSVASPSSSALPSPQPSSSTVADLARGVEWTVTLQDRALVIPRRPESVGKKIQVRANHFLVEVADRDLHRYDVSISYTNFVSFFLYTFGPLCLCFYPPKLLLIILFHIFYFTLIF